MVGRMPDTLSAIVATPRRGRARPALYVGLVGDASRTPPARIGLGGGDRVDIGRGEQRVALRREVDGASLVALALPDARMSFRHACISRLGPTWVLEDLQSKNGTWVGGQQIARRPLTDGDAIIFGHTAVVFRETGGEETDLDELPPQIAPGLVTLSPALAARFAELAAAARSPIPIEISGETGTGKELVARAVHALSGRGGRFVAVNCGALPGSLLEAELFGHKRGAYTGAADERAGLVRSADGGTLFLDEVAELPSPSQAALLRVLQEGEVVPLGADRPVKVDLRIVTASHRQLDAEVAASRFRADLRARMLGVAFTLPPLRERREDLGLLVSSLLDRVAAGREIAFSADAVAALYTYEWPLNIRELERALGAAISVARDRIELQHLPAAIREARDLASLTTEDRTLRETLTASIARHDGNLAAVARDLGKDRTQIRRWMKRIDLWRDDDD